MNKKQNLKQKLKQIRWVEKVKKQVKEIKRVKTQTELENKNKIKKEERRKRRLIIIILILLLLLLLFIKIIFMGNGEKIAKTNENIFNVENQNTIFEKINKNTQIKISTENIIEENETLENSDKEVNNEKIKKEISNNKINLDKNTYKGNNNTNYVTEKEGNNSIQNTENLSKNEDIKTDENIENNKQENNIQDENKGNTEDNENKNEENNKPEKEENKEPIIQEEAKRQIYITGKVITENVNNEHIATITLYKASNTILVEEIKTIKTNKDGTFKILIYEAKESEIIDLNNNNIPDEIEGTYNIKITKQGYLNSTITGIKFNKNIDILKIGTYKLIAGDVDGSDIIELMDMVTVVGYYGTIITEENKEEMQKYDLNGDGKIDELDKDILMQNYDKYAKEEEWQDIN